MDCPSSIAFKNIQDDDIALAMLLQEQERALYLFGRPTSVNHPEEEELTDEELARRLQEEEDQAAYQALAYGDPAYREEVPESSSPHTNDTRSTGAQEQELSERPFTYEDMLALGDLAGKVSKGLREDALSRLPVASMCSLRTAESALTLDRCCICQLEFEEQDEVTPLPCRHCYHSGCVKQWLQQSRACPVCGKELDLTAAA